MNTSNSTSNVTAIPDPGNGTIEGFNKWVDAMAQRGSYPQARAYQCKTAVKNLVSILDNTEPRDVKWILANIDTLADRFAVKASCSPSSRNTYRGKSYSALSDYISFLENPGAFKPKPARERAERKPRGSQAEPRAEEQTSIPMPSENSEQETPPAPAAPMPLSRHRTYVYPLGNGREFSFTVPQDFVIRDLHKVLHFLAPLTEDFDPSRHGWSVRFTDKDSGGTEIVSR